MKQNEIIAAFIFGVVLLGGFLIFHSKSEVKYLDIACPRCGSCEVGDFGETVQGQHGFCFDCECDFYISGYENFNEYDYEDEE